MWRYVSYSASVPTIHGHLTFVLTCPYLLYTPLLNSHKNDNIIVGKVIYITCQFNIIYFAI